MKRKLNDCWARLDIHAVIERDVHDAGVTGLSKML